MSSAPFGTVLTAMVTPFREDGSVDFDAVQRVARHLVDHGHEDRAGDRPVRLDDALAQHRHERLPELIPALLDAGYVALAVDLRGFGETERILTLEVVPAFPTRLREHLLQVVAEAVELGFLLDIDGGDGNTTSRRTAIRRGDDGE